MPKVEKEGSLYVFTPTEEEVQRTRRRASATKRWWNTRYNHWIKKGCPPTIATWLANQGFPIYPRTEEDKAAKSRLNDYIKEMKADIEEFMAEGLSKSEAIRKFLNLLKEKNKRRGRDSYNLFTFGS